jgi:iron complex transport system substrate-binding protein
MKKSFYALGSAGVLLLTLLLTACGDATSTPPAPTTAAATATVAPTSAAAPTTAPATTVAATTAASTTAVAPTTAPATTAAVATTSAAGQDYSFKDSTDTTIALSKPAERIVCLSFECIDWLAELGMTPVAIAKDASLYISSPYFFGDKGAQIPQLAGSSTEPNLEDIARAKPDLVIGYQYFNDSIVEPLKTVAPLVRFLASDYNQALENFKAIGKATGHSAQAEASVQKFLAHLAAYKAKAVKPKSLMVIGNPDSKTLFLQVKGSLHCELISVLANCTFDLPADAPPEYAAFGTAPVSMEQVLKVNSDAIFAFAYPDAPTTTDLYKDNPIWKNLTAVKNNMAFNVSADVWDTAGIRGMSLALDDVATKLYPDIFPKALP